MTKPSLGQARRQPPPAGPLALLGGHRKFCALGRTWGSHIHGGLLKLPAGPLRGFGLLYAPSSTRGERQKTQASAPVEKDRSIGPTVPLSVGPWAPPHPRDPAHPPTGPGACATYTQARRHPPLTSALVRFRASFTVLGAVRPDRRVGPNHAGEGRTHWPSGAASGASHHPTQPNPPLDGSGLPPSAVCTPGLVHPPKVLPSAVQKRPTVPMGARPGALCH